MKVTDEFARRFAEEWIDSWNAHDLPRILSHYSEDFEMSSPKIITIAGEPSGKLSGKENVRAYWKTALKKLPNLRFELLGVYTGVSSLVIHYQSNSSQQAAESLYFNDEGLVFRAAAHYNSPPAAN
jgi:hypothetical protein